MMVFSSKHNFDGIPVASPITERLIYRTGWVGKIGAFHPISCYIPEKTENQLSNQIKFIRHK